jgi:hypothetical protein
MITIIIREALGLVSQKINQELARFFDTTPTIPALFIYFWAQENIAKVNVLGGVSRL